MMTGAKGGGMICCMRLGIAHHFGWAVAVTASSAYEVVERRRVALIEPGLPAAPIHHEAGTHPMHASGAVLDDDGLAALVIRVRDSVMRMVSAALDELESAAPEPITVIALRAWPSNFPNHIAIHASCWAKLRMNVAGPSAPMTPATSRPKRRSSWAIGRMKCSTVHGQHWVLRGRRTTGWRSLQRS